MWLQKNYDVCYDINAVQLRLLAYGHAALSTEWQGTIISPMYSRIYYIIGGDPYIIKDGRKIPLEIGKCYLLPTGYSLYHACETHVEQLYFHVNLNDFSGQDILRTAEGLMEYSPDEETVSRLLSYVHSDEFVDGLRLRQEIHAALLLLFEKYGIHLALKNYSKCVRLAIEYIKSHLSLRLSIGELAENTFISESTLSKKFRADVGITIGKYIDDAVMFEAEQMLLNSDMSVLEISEHFGFCDQFYFSRRFKKKYGQTPQKYRKLKLI